MNNLNDIQNFAIPGNKNQMPVLNWLNDNGQEVPDIIGRRLHIS